MDQAKHKRRHQELHKKLDELFADWIVHGGGGIQKPIIELIEWSYRQTKEPDHEQPGGTDG